MKKVVLILSLFLALMGPAGAFTSPTDDQIAQVLSAPSELPDLIRDASPEESAEVVFRVIRMARETPSLDEYQRRQVAALMTARGIFTVKVGDAAFMGTLLGYMFSDWKPLVSAAGVTAARESIHDVKELLQAITDREQEGPLKDQMQTAVDEPKVILGDELYYIIAAILPHVPIKDMPAATLSIPLPPPPPFREGSSVRVLRETGQRRTPSVARKYPGQ